MPKPLEQLLDELLPDRRKQVRPARTSFGVDIPAEFEMSRSQRQAAHDVVPSFGASAAKPLRMFNEGFDLITDFAEQNITGTPPSPFKQFSARTPGEPEVGPLPLSEGEEKFLKFASMSRGETDGVFDKGIGTAAVSTGQIGRVLLRLAHIGKRVTTGIAANVIDPPTPEGGSRGFIGDRTAALLEEGHGLINMMDDAIPQLMLAGPEFVAQSVGAEGLSPDDALDMVDSFMGSNAFSAYKLAREQLGRDDRSEEDWRVHLINKANEAYAAPEIPYFGAHLTRSVGKAAVKGVRGAGRFAKSEFREAQKIAADPTNTQGQKVFQLERADALLRRIQKDEFLDKQEAQLAGLSPESNAAARRVLGPELESPQQGKAQAKGGQPLKELKTAEERAAGTLAKKPKVVEALDKLTGREGSPTKSAAQSAKAFHKGEAPESVKSASKAQSLKKDLKAKETKRQAEPVGVKPVVADGPAVAKELGVIFKGEMELTKGRKAFRFQDPTNGGDFSVKDLSKAGAELKKLRANPPVKPPKSKPAELKAGKKPVVETKTKTPAIKSQDRRVFKINERNREVAEAVNEGFKASGFQGNQVPNFEAGYFDGKRNVDPGPVSYRSGNSATPEWWLNKGYKPKEMIVISGKVLSGDKITARQTGLFVEAAKDWMRARRAELHGKRDRSTGELLDKSGAAGQKEYIDGILRGDYFFVPAALAAAGALAAGSEDDRFAVAGLLSFFGGKKKGKRSLTPAEIASTSLRKKKVAVPKVPSGRAPKVGDVPRGTIPTKQRPAVSYTGSTEKPLQRVGLKQSELEGLRKYVGLDKLPETERQSIVGWMEQAKAEGYDRTAFSIAKSEGEVKAGTFSSREGLSVTQQMGLGMQLIKARQEFDRVNSMLKEFHKQEDIRAIERNRPRLGEIIEEISSLTMALKRGGTEAARILVSKQAVFDVETAELSSVLSRARLAKGTRLTKEENTRFKEMSETDLSLEGKLDKAQAKWDAEVDVREKARADAIVRAQQKLTAEKKQRSTAKTKELKSRDDIKARLRELGFRANDITGLPVEVAFLVGKLAFSHIKDGARGLEEVSKRVIADIPDLNKKDVIQALIAQSPKAQKKAKSAVTKAKSHILRQARLEDKIEKAKQGIFDAPKERPATPADIKALMKQYKELKEQAYETIPDPHRLQQVVHTITLLREQLDGHYRILKNKERLTPAEITAFKKEAAILRKEMRLTDLLADLNEQLRTGEFKIPEKQVAPEVPSHIHELQVKVSIARRKRRMAIEELAPWTFGRKVAEVGSFFRTMQATADMSAVFRQGFLLIATRPVVASQAFGKAAKAMFSEHSAEAYDLSIRNAPHHWIREGADLWLSELGGRLTKGEELYANSWADKFPVWGKVIKGSERHMTTFLNQLRVAAFDQFLEKRPNATMPELRAWADYINKASGRGTLKPDVAAGLSLGMFAPRFAISRVQAPLAIVGKKQRGLKRVQKEIAKELVASAALGGTALTLAHFAGLGVGLDPDEADWGKIRFGDTRIDIWAGMQQPMRAFYRIGRLVTDRLQVTDNALRRDEDPFDITEQFLEYKSAPLLTITHDLMTGVNMIGEEVAPHDVLFKSVIPITFQSVYEAMQEDGIDALGQSETYSGPAFDFFGLGAQQYKDNESRTRRNINNAIVEGDTFKAYSILQAWNIRNPHKADKISSSWVKKQISKFRKGN